jgi:hypothetical protein
VYRTVGQLWQLVTGMVAQESEQKCERLANAWTRSWKSSRPTSPSAIRFPVIAFGAD